MARSMTMTDEDEILRCAQDDKGGSREPLVCHAERREASRCPSSQTLRFAQGDSRAEVHAYSDTPCGCQAKGHSMSMEDEQQLEPRWRVGLIGDPVAHSYSPRFQQAALDALGIPARYELWQTPRNELAARVASLRAPRCMGANITIPHKEAVLPLLDVVDPLAARIGAVNTVVHRDEYLYGYNTDATGLLYALVEQGVGMLMDAFSFKGYTAVLLG